MLLTAVAPDHVLRSIFGSQLLHRTARPLIPPSSRIILDPRCHPSCGPSPAPVPNRDLLLRPKNGPHHAGSLNLQFLTVYERRAIIVHMSMTSLNISLPQPLKDFVEERVKEGGYSTPSEYVRGLLREDQKRRAEERLEALLLEGLNSGKPIAVTPEYWEKKRQQLIKRHNTKNKVKR